MITVITMSEGGSNRPKGNDMVSDWRQRKKEELRQLLYHKAIELFESQGYEKTTVQQITEAVGVAKGTFFNHFPTKEHVVEAWYQGITVEALAAAQERRDLGAEEAICRLCEDMARRAVECRELLLAKARHGSNPLLLAAEQAQEAETDAFFARHCKAGKERGELDESLDVPFFVGILGAVLTGTSRDWVTRQAFDFPRRVRERLHFLFRCARAQTGEASPES